MRNVSYKFNEKGAWASKLSGEGLSILFIYIFCGKLYATLCKIDVDISFSTSYYDSGTWIKKVLKTKR